MNDMTNPQMLSRAKAYAKRPYQVRIFLDETTDGEPVFVAEVPEMPGCHTHGDTVRSAEEWLESLKVDFIYFLLEDGLPVPEPRLLGSRVCVDQDYFFDYEDDEASANVVADFETTAAMPEPVA